MVVISLCTLKFDLIFSDIQNVKIQLLDLATVCAWTIHRGTKSEKKTENQRAKAKWRAKRSSHKSEEPESQQSTLWEIISTHNKSLLVIVNYTNTHLCTYGYIYTPKQIEMSTVHLQALQFVSRQENP